MYEQKLKLVVFHELLQGPYFSEMMIAGLNLDQRNPKKMERAK